MKAKKKLCIAVVTFSLLGACAACAPVEGKSSAVSETTSSADSVAVSQDVLKRINGGDNSEWSQEFPDQYLSYLEGIGELEPSTASSDLGEVHSHAALRTSMDVYGAQDGQISYLESSGAACLSCKSTLFTDLYEEKGMEAYKVPYSEVKDKYAYWDCLACHEGKPGGKVGGYLIAGKTLLRNFPITLTDKDMACAQCHNSLTPYSRDAMSTKAINEKKALDDIDPYRYGVDAEALLKAELEDGIELSTDKETGLQTLYMPVSDIELLQGSTHQSMGLTCTDCHMPTTKNSTGQEFTSHNASQGPLENDVALEKCLTCHEKQGIGSVDQMRDWVLDKQSKLGEQETILAERLAEIETSMVTAIADGKDAITLDKIRNNYLRAKLYLDYTKGAVHTPGQKIAHNPTASKDYIERGNKLAEEALALF